jgi:flagellar basal body-associated protein FliL
MKRFAVNVVIPILMVLFVLSLAYQMYSFWSFKQQGKRFTSTNGQELCMRIQELEVKTGIEPKRCDY